jgi:hypothetical protein
MMKWFRKHNKQLLAVFASALLVVWLGGQAFERMFQRNPLAETVGTAYGKKLTGGDYAAVKRRLDLLQSMGIAWQVPWRNPWVMSQLNLPKDRQLPQDPIMMAGARPLTGNRGLTQWWLLEQEAHRMGVTISQNEVDRFLKQYGITADQLTMIRDNAKVSTDDLIATIAEYLRVSYAAVLASAGVQVTDPEVKDIFVQTNDQVSLRYALVPREAFEAGKDPAATTQPVSDAELQDLFNQYKDNLVGAGKYGFGYKVPDRVSVQYVGANVDDIVRTLPPVSEERAHKYFEAHKDKFQPPKPQTTQPTTQPVVKFEEVKDRVIEQIRQDDASTLLKSVMEEIRASAFSEFSGSKADLDAGKIPDSLKSVLENRRNEFANSRKLPLVYRQTGLISQEEAGKEPGINTASAAGSQGQPVPFADCAFSLEKTAPKPDQPQAEEAASKIKLYQPVPVRDEAGGRLRGMYIFRVVSQEAAHAPAAMVEVKDKVEHDAKIVQALKKADQAAQNLLAAAQKDGLKVAFAAEFPALATRPVTTRPTTRPATPEVELFEQDSITRARAIPSFFVHYNDTMSFPTHLLGIQDVERSAPSAKRVLDAAFDLLAISASQPANRVSLVELPSQKAYVVVEVSNHKPANETDFAKAKMGLVADMRTQKLRNFYARWYDPEQIEKRTGWQSKGPAFE